MFGDSERQHAAATRDEAQSDVLLWLSLYPRASVLGRSHFIGAGAVQAAGGVSTVCSAVFSERWFLCGGQVSVSRDALFGEARRWYVSEVLVVSRDEFFDAELIPRRRAHRPGGSESDSVLVTEGSRGRSTRELT